MDEVDRICKGETRDKEPCKSLALGRTDYCYRHEYMIPYTIEMRNSLKNCMGCQKRMYLGNNKRCNECSIKKDGIVKCKGIDRNKDPCRNKPINDTNFCKYHEYLKDLTDDMLNKLKICSNCHMAFYSEQNKTCENCRNRGKDIRFENKKHIILCKFPDCTFKKSDENDYCGHHDLQQWKDEVIAMGKKPCEGSKRVCREVLDINYKYEYCLTCRCKQKDRLRDVKKSAERRNHVFELEDEEVLYLLCQPCHYCTKEITEDYEHGLDRVDNDRGYTYDNVVPCCDVCNTMKKKYDVQTFIQYCINIDKHYPCYDLINNMIDEPIETAKIQNVQKGAIERNLNFDLTQEQFNEIISYKCIYCANTNFDFNNLDRVDSTKGYEINNVVPCCSRCNFMKNNYELDIFIDTVKRVALKHGKNNINKFIHTIEIKKAVICKGYKKGNIRCDKMARDGFTTCIIHDHQENYTDEQLEKLIMCSDCKKMFFMTNTQCNNCIVEANEKLLLENELNPKCIYCNKLPKSKDNDYCDNHQKQYIRKKSEDEGKKVCLRFDQCGKILEKKYPFDQCSDCREKNRIKYKNQKELNKEKQITQENDNIFSGDVDCKSNNNIPIHINDTNKKNCADCKQSFAKSDFVKKNNEEIPLCKKCVIKLAGELIYGTNGKSENSENIVVKNDPVHIEPIKNTQPNTHINNVKTKQCTSCNKHYALDNYINKANGHETATCDNCRVLNARADSKRPNRNRNYAQEERIYKEKKLQNNNVEKALNIIPKLLNDQFDVKINNKIETNKNNLFKSTDKILNDIIDDSEKSEPEIYYDSDDSDDSISSNGSVGSKHSSNANANRKNGQSGSERQKIMRAIKREKLGDEAYKKLESEKRKEQRHRAKQQLIDSGQIVQKVKLSREEAREKDRLRKQKERAKKAVETNTSNDQ